jgi:branched-chain amino acid transport system substrate-binding protein
VSDDVETRTLDRGQLLKRAGLGAAAASLTFERGAWAGLMRPAQGRELRVGHLLTLSGPNSAAAIDVKRGFVAYVRSRGSRLGGRRIRMIDGDDAGDPGTAIRQVQRLVQEEEVDVIEGIFFSNILLAVRDTIDSFRKPTIVANAAANAITRERRSRYMFRTSYTNWQLGAPLARWATRRVTRQGMVIMAANYAAGQESSAAFRQIYTAAGGRVAGDTIFVPFPTVPDYQPYLAQARERGARAIWMFTGSGAESIKFVRQYREFGLGRIPLIGNNNLTDPQSTLDAMGAAAVGLRTNATWAPTLKNEENRRFLRNYDRFGIGTPSAFAELGYIAAQFIDLALRRIGGDTSNSDRFIQAMERVGTIRSPGGPLAMDPNTHQVVVPMYLRQVVRSGNGYTQKLIGNLGLFRDPGR